MKNNNPNHNNIGGAYLQIYRRNEKGIKLLIVVAILLFLAGMAGLISNLFIEESTFFDLNLWNSLLFIFFGILYTILMRKSLQDKKYHISWNEKEINFLLPKQKEPEYININDIKTVAINDREIKITLKNDQEKNINLNFIFLPQRDMVRVFFETLKEKSN